jgi:hypothetical protein
VTGSNGEPVAMQRAAVGPFEQLRGRGLGQRRRVGQRHDERLLDVGGHVA